MLSSLRKCHQFSGVERLKIGVILASAAVLSGCSADIARFDLGGSPESARSDYASSGTTGRTASSDYGSAGYERPAERGPSVARSELPPTPQAPLTTAAIPPEQSPRTYGQSDSYAPPRQPNYYGGAQQQRTPQYTPHYGNSGSSQGVAPVASRNAGPKGDMIEVRPGDTLYGISRRHSVSLNELMTVNGLSSPSLKPGQKLYLPAGSTAATETARPAHEPNYNTAAASAAAPSQYAAEAPSDWTRSYTVQSGDSMYGIARQNGVKLAELERYNGITDSRRVKPGTVIKLPGGGAGTPVADASSASDAERSPAPSAQAGAPYRDAPDRNTTQTPSPAPGAVRLGEVTNAPGASSAQQPTLLNGSGGEERVARAETPGTASDAVSPSSAENAGSVAGSTKLRWPVAGKVISGFGSRPDGTHNDGVNLATPMGTDVHAAETGVVAYAGDELKGYGNLVLIRHDNGWVTAYAHADEIMVKRGDRIKRGQVIAKAGRTGQVDQPQVHFELRQGQKPVDPTPFMERL
jgi:murein DD-endopeptidase MepM/ murein hydrolase activator NlpD